LIGFGGIMGGKADDSLAVPMCRECHTYLHDDDSGQFWTVQIKWLQDTLRQAVEHGAHKLWGK